MLIPISVIFEILSFHCTHDLTQGPGGGHSEPRVATHQRMQQSGRQNAPPGRKH
jgi:hypothetical protein